MFARIESPAKTVDDAITDFMKSYFLENFNIEKEYLDKNASGDKDYFKVAIAKKIDVHKKYWCNLNEFWMPCGIGSEPNFNWSRVKNIGILRSEDDNNMQYLFTFLYAKLQDSDYESNEAYILKLKDNNLMIDQNFY